MLSEMVEFASNIDEILCITGLITVLNNGSAYVDDDKFICFLITCRVSLPPCRAALTILKKSRPCKMAGVESVTK